MNQAEIDRRLNEGTDRHWLIEKVGRQIGHRIEGGLVVNEWYVLDGKVYLLGRNLDGNMTQSQFLEDYFEFCRKLRQGEVTGFVAENGFHLSNRESTPE